MYVSRAVRSIREHPVEGETVSLLVEAEAEDEDAVDALEDRLADAGAAVEERLAFGTVRVTVPHERVGDVCEVAGVAAVETAKTLELDPDAAGEDVDPEAVAGGSPDPDGVAGDGTDGPAADADRDAG